MHLRIAIAQHWGWVGAIIGIALSVSTAGAQTTFSESDFGPGTYTVEVVQGGSGGTSAINLAISHTSSSSLSAGTALFTKPMRSASFPSTNRRVMNNSLALRRPKNVTHRGMLSTPPL